MHEGVNGLLRDRSRPPGKAPIPPERVAEIVRLTQQAPPHEATHWTLRAMAKVAGVAASTVQAIWKAHGLSPHRWRHFKLSNDPAFAEKLTDIVGLYVDPPAHAVVLSVDEKSQIQALDRTQPGLPMKKGRAGTMTYDYKQHGTTTLFAAAQCAGRYGHRTEHAAPPPSGVHPLPQPHRARGADGQGRPRHPRQLRRAQEGQGPRLARPPSTLDLPLHANLVLVAQCRRGLLRQTNAAQAQIRRLPIRRRPSGRHQPICPANTMTQTQNPSSGKPTPIISSPHETEGSKRWNQSTRTRRRCAMPTRPAGASRSFAGKTGRAARGCGPRSAATRSLSISTLRAAPRRLRSCSAKPSSTRLSSATATVLTSGSLAFARGW